MLGAWHRPACRDKRCKWPRRMSLNHCPVLRRLRSLRGLRSIAHPARNQIVSQDDDARGNWILLYIYIYIYIYIYTSFIYRLLTILFYHIIYIRQLIISCYIIDIFEGVLILNIRAPIAKVPLNEIIRACWKIDKPDFTGVRAVGIRRLHLEKGQGLTLLQMHAGIHHQGRDAPQKKYPSGCFHNGRFKNVQKTTLPPMLILSSPT